MVEQVSGARMLARKPTSEQHPASRAGLREPRTRTHSLVHRDRRLEVQRRVAPALQPRRADAEIARDRAPKPLRMVCGPHAPIVASPGPAPVDGFDWDDFAIGVGAALGSGGSRRIEGIPEAPRSAAT
jgi:hypothetical protein